MAVSSDGFVEINKTDCTRLPSAVAEDDAPLVKHIGQSFRFSAVEVSSSSLKIE